MPQTNYSREKIAVEISEYNQVAARASDLQISLYGLVSMVGENPDLKVIALQAAESIDLLRDLARGRVNALRSLKVVAPANDESGQAA